jgi:hypothetical protein
MLAPFAFGSSYNRLILHRRASGIAAESGQISTFDILFFESADPIRGDRK